MASVWGELKRRNVVRVAIAYVIIAWLILQVGDTLAPALYLDEWVNTVLAFFLILGFPIALFFAWAFEITPQGVKKEKDVDRSQSITHITGRKFDYLIIAALALALGYFAFDKFVLDASRDAELVRTTTEALTEQVAESGDAETSDKSIAVLAFDNLSPDADNAYFAEGISEEILNVLAGIDGLTVTSRTSAFSFRGGDTPIPEIARQLGVAHVLEGSVRKQGTRVRITAQLIDAATDTHVWSDSYDRELSDIFVVQEEIAQSITTAMQGVPKPQLSNKAQALKARLAAAQDDEDGEPAPIASVHPALTTPQLAEAGSAPPQVPAYSPNISFPTVPVAQPQYVMPQPAQQFSAPAPASGQLDRMIALLEQRCRADAGPDTTTEDLVSLAFVGIFFMLAVHALTPPVRYRR